MHTTSAVKSIDRLLDALPAEQREQGKLFLSQNLHAVVTQILVKTEDGLRRKPIVEIMLMTNAISNLILSDKTFQVPNQMQTERSRGMQLMDQALLEALQAKKIDPDDAYLHANDKKHFQRFVTDPALLPNANALAG